MVIYMVMEKINDTELKRLQNKYKFKFCKIEGTNVINITKHPDNPRLVIIDFDTFVTTLKKRKLAVYRDQGDFLKIMKDR